MATFHTKISMSLRTAAVKTVTFFDERAFFSTEIPIRRINSCATNPREYTLTLISLNICKEKSQLVKLSSLSCDIRVTFTGRAGMPRTIN